MKKKRLVYSRFRQSDLAVLGREAHLNESYEESVRNMVVPDQALLFLFSAKMIKTAAS
ncbi:hypothetical protein NKT34_28370 [Paenibacillus polysaccharolyticus]|uniref:hypothetical protein n=1 Tax=Paenibacillus polysaccharolyticus TaxID=582692 RepID=UPI00209CB1F3|nr:hypothetical protein [Paenibacillus polysaccharolyticus]MCP1137171.1 hypothetical protein [Paenibacillus polysaccharolyticus]